MKSLGVLAVAGLALSRLASADTVVGTADVTVSFDQGGESTVEYREVTAEGGNKILGEGQIEASGNSVINLTRTATGLQGFDAGRPFNLSCSATVCTDAGSNQVNLKVAQTTDGYTLDGSFNFVPVHAVVSSQKITLSGDGSFTALAGKKPGSFSGDDGSFLFGITDTFTIDIDSTGTFAGFTDPALFITAILNNFVR